MSEYRLTYFNIRGVAEPIRQLFHISNTPFEDVRIPMSDPQWLELKKKTPFGKLPVLSVDGFDIPQSAAILRFLSRKFGFAGKTPEEEAWIDAIVDQFKDFSESSKVLFYAIRKKKSKEEIQKIREEIFGPAKESYFQMLNRILEQNESGFLVGDGLTWADLVIADNIFGLEKLNALEDDNPVHQNLKSYQMRIHGIPALKEYIENRPETEV